MRIVLNQQSGLGNQLFQYAAAIYFGDLYSARVEVCTTRGEAVSFGHPRPFLLPKFQVSARIRERTRFDRLMSSRSKRFAPAQLLCGARSHDRDAAIVWGFQDSLPGAKWARLLYLNGYFQAHQYAASVEFQLRRELTLRDAPLGKNLEMLRRIHESDCAVSVHLRRGDYLVDRKDSVLTMAYYENALAAIRAKHSNPTFFVFSDDMAFARENLSHIERVVFVGHNREEEAHEDLRLMASCHHHIIANSSFSWWGAWLNPHVDKQVVVPDRWLGSMPPHPDLVPPTWQLVAS
jgi:hypothetical protein